MIDAGNSKDEASGVRSHSKRNHQRVRFVPETVSEEVAEANDLLSSTNGSADAANKASSNEATACDVSDSLSAGSAASLYFRSLAASAEATEVASAPGHEFVNTPVGVAAAALTRVIKHWKVPQSLSHTKCCPLHAQLEVVVALANTMRANSKCKPSWSTHGSWQCGKCRYVNGEDHFMCPQCSENLDDDDDTALGQ
jgi:hypothetical protein